MPTLDAFPNAVIVSEIRKVLSTQFETAAMRAAANASPLHIAAVNTTLLLDNAICTPVARDLLDVSQLASNSSVR